MCAPRFIVTDNDSFFTRPSSWKGKEQVKPVSPVPSGYFSPVIERKPLK